MAFRDLMPWGRRGREAMAHPIENVQGLMASMQRAFEEPWELTSARLLGAEWTPKLEVKETEKEIHVTASLPGLEKHDLHVSATEDTLTIRGMKKTELDEKGEKAEKKGKSEKVEGAAGSLLQSFYRSISLPSTIRPDEVKAKFKDGQLTITLPKAKHSQVRRIQIQ
jgi:HSP20 family protein